MTTRAEQKRATRQRILDAAATLLADRGYAALSTLAVQQAAGVSRGALLHHFPTSHDLTTALVAHLVTLNEAATRAEVAALGPADPIERTLTALARTFARAPARAEQELWSAARTDPALAAVLRAAERAAGRDLVRVVDDLFGPDITAHPRYPAIRDLTITILRGVSAARPLRESSRAETATLAHWADTIRLLLGAVE